MTLGIPSFQSADSARHEPGGELWVGVRTPGTEGPERAERIAQALTAAGAQLRPADPAPDEALLAVHDPALLDYLRTAWEGWVDAGLHADPGADRVVPYLFPHPGLLGELPAKVPASTAARAGAFAYDTMTLIGPGTWDAARGAAGAGLAAADAVAQGESLAYALCRPPGHHATRTAFGGSCYLNNAAAAAARLRERVVGPVAVLDIDAHHGNGTQSIFYREGDVLTGSVHVDPGAGWFPHHVGFEDERGAGDGEGANRNICLAPGTGDDGWVGAVAELAAWAAERGPAAVVVCLGVDVAAGDPESPLAVSADGLRAAGAELAALGAPTAVVQEGGYDLERLGELVVAALEGMTA